MIAKTLPRATVASYRRVELNADQRRVIRVMAATGEAMVVTARFTRVVLTGAALAAFQTSYPVATRKCKAKTSLACRELFVHGAYTCNCKACAGQPDTCGLCARNKYHGVVERMGTDCRLVQRAIDADDRRRHERGEKPLSRPSRRSSFVARLSSRGSAGGAEELAALLVGEIATDAETLQEKFPDSAISFTATELNAALHGFGGWLDGPTVEEVGGGGEGEAAVCEEEETAV